MSKKKQEHNLSHLSFANADTNAVMNFSKFSHFLEMIKIHQKNENCLIVPRARQQLYFI